MIDDKEFRALIQLLDDEDPEVSEHVWGKLIGLGETGIDRLEAEWEVQEDPEIQEKIEELIDRIYHESVASNLLEWRKGGGQDLLEGWMHVTRFQFPDLDLEPYKDEINRLVNKTWLEVNQSMDSVSKIRVLNHILFVMEGYKANRRNSRYPHNSLLNYLIDQKRGNAHSLGLLYLIIAQKLNFPVGGVILPGYFVVYFNEGNREFFIDIYNGGAFFTKADLKRFLSRLNVPEQPRYFKPTSNIYMILELIRIMMADFKNLGQEDKVEELALLLKDIEISFD